MKRRQFLQATALTAGALSTSSLAPLAATPNPKWQSSAKSGFTLWQIPSHRDNIGNSYVMRTTDGRVVVMDGGTPEEEMTLRGFIGALGNEVDTWYISHPHNDHIGALNEILKNQQDLRIRRIVHSPLSEEVKNAEPAAAPLTNQLYQRLESLTHTEVIAIDTPGRTFEHGPMSVKVLGVANPEFVGNPYNNSSMILRVWDRKKSILFLGDAGVECGRKVLEGQYGKELDSEYIQMAHHGQNGCDEHFYQSVKFRACLWPTPTWVWNNDQGKGFNSGILKTLEVRTWMDRLGISEHHVSCTDGLWQLD